MDWITAAGLTIMAVLVTISQVLGHAEALSDKVCKAIIAGRKVKDEWNRPKKQIKKPREKKSRDAS
ncbi:hypothetical protein [Streptomyces sp.]|uniref:hypothetical protein n=1 Tax=Streptomyces sp. TaxID=1931 RepID=UPI002F91D4BD